MPDDNNNGREGYAVTLIKQLGVPTAILVVLLGFLGYMFRWSAANVAEPLIRSHTEFLQKLTADQHKNTEATIKVAATIEAVAETLESQTRILQDNQQILKTIAEDQREHRKASDK